MQEFTEFNGHKVEIKRRPRQRYLRLRVTKEGFVRVSCPVRAGKREIEAFVVGSEDFIQRSLRAIAAHQARHPRRQFETGETILFFGQRLQLTNIWTWGKTPRINRIGSEFELITPITSTSRERRSAVLKYFQRIAHLHLKTRLQHFAQAMQLRPRKVSIRGQKSRWGSCSAKGEISLNWKLICAPAEIIDYVVVHELAHLAHLNHSPRFWQLVGSHFPEYSKAKRWLREHEDEIAALFCE